MADREPAQSKTRAPAHTEVFALFGPTGVGKTAIAVALAELLRERGESPVAVSADALQVYSGLETLTGVASPAERAALEHRLLSFLPLDATFSAGEYAKLAHAEIDGLLASGERPIVVGGTGLYLRAALADLDLRPAPEPATRERLMADLQQRGSADLHRRLAEVAPSAALGIDEQDWRRIVRALELAEAGELPPERDRSQLWSDDLRHRTLLAALTMRREALYERIDARVDAMIAAGVLEEVRGAQAAGVSMTARKALGFDELLAGDIDAMKRRTRNYARRQLTWMRKLAGAVPIDVTDRSASSIAEEILDSAAS
ncbi:MAG TPA: tRNA (adenosine(37)-N6)-dimethylallyltransferase MiaA [Solirubrobacteraceae bacterium]|nr:tRNA (adenosine(37)-N6)-dimethylallyltransferase MiaA [Solirubrobacteraceae bacterium]